MFGLAITLSACDRNEKTETPPTPQAIELIQDDLVAVKSGESVQTTAFTGTIRAINQSSLQAQVSATATTVTAQVGDRVQKGQILVRLNNQDNAARLAQAQANKASAQAQANQAKLMMERKQRLLNQGFISKVEYEQSRVDYQAQLENVRAQQANVDISLKADQDGIIKSPIDGVITKREVEPGQTVAIGQTLFEIVDPQKLEIQAKLPSDLQSSLRVGNAIEYQIQGNPNRLTAHISRISPIADQASRQIEFFATPKETISSLSIGSFVEGKILSSQKLSGQIIPLDVVRNAESKPYLWVVRQNKLIKVQVELLEQRYQDNTAVIKGLIAGDQVSRIEFTDADIQKTVSIDAKQK
ncbi:efflux RND transporter periplasmic adaptor subunit [Acinetobacter sp. NCu2D-2]|uniref:efflux RND transporter periplasmic adaptor subunit n=1 Tax=Acinetobacter sp. NCu2D-2 TaxID=1608473 RepID=UPI001D0CFCFA|nr:efflux RND transporter periplasmic adaptor subunit [Acinetobacter sp. NCu2D-2]